MKSKKSSKDFMAMDLKFIDIKALMAPKNRLACPKDSPRLSGTIYLQESTCVTNNTETSGSQLYIEKEKKIK